MNQGWREAGRVRGLPPGRRVRGAAGLRPRFPVLVTFLVTLLASMSPNACTPGDRAASTSDRTPAETNSGADLTIARLLFSEGADGLSEDEQVQIAQALGFRASVDGDALVDDACGQPLSIQVRYEDLNADGDPEVVVDYGNACTSGMAGTSVAVFVRDSAGRYGSNLGVPGMIAEVLSTANHGFSDLLIGGPGFCFGVWRWNGMEYAHFRNEPQAPGGCDGVEGLR